MGTQHPIKFAVVGYGNQGKRHVQAIENNHHAELCAVVDNNPAKLYGLNNSFPSIRSIKTNPDVICIATPNGRHPKHAMQALEKAEYVVIEKPVGLKDVDHLLLYDKRIFCVMQNRFTPAAQWLKSLDFGKIFSIHVNCFWNRERNYYDENSWRGTKQMDGGCLYTQFSHFLDIMVWIGGDVTLVGGIAKNLNHSYIDIDDCGAFTFKMNEGGIASFCYSTNATDGNMESSITIIGEKGTVKVGGQYMQKIEYCKGFEMPDLEQPQANQYKGYEGSAGNIQNVIDNVVDVIHGKSNIAVPIQDGVKIVNLINEMYHVQKMRKETSTSSQAENQEAVYQD